MSKDRSKYSGIAFEHSPLGIIIVSIDGHFLDVNEKFANIVGYSREQLVNMSIFELTHPDDAEKSADILHLVQMSKGTHLELEKRYISATGKIIWVEVNTICVDGLDGELLVVSQVTDITQRYENRIKLQNELNLRGTILDSLPVAVAYSNLDGLIKDCNQAFEKLLGVKKADIQDQHPRNIVNGEASGKLTQWNLDITKNAGFKTLELELVQSTGEKKQINIISALLPDYSGFISTWIDRTEELKIESEFRQLFNSIGDAVFLFEQKADGLPGRILEVNRSACVRYGYTREEFLELEGKDVNTPESAAKMPAGAKKLLKDSKVLVSRKHKTKNGETFPAEVNANRFVLNGKPMILTIARDVTDRDHALEVSEMKSNFLAHMSHEIRTPLNAIVGVCDLLLESNLPESERELATTMQSASKQLLSLICDILDISKIEAGKLDIEYLEFDCLEFLQEIYRVMCSLSNKKGLKFILEIQGIADRAGGKRIFADQGRLGQILYNLIGNAIKFTSRGSVTLRVIEFNRINDLKSSLRFEVADTGIGFDLEKKSELFRPFTQGDASMTRKFGGTGLGLSISKGLIHLMGGKIDIDSNPSGGSIFWFELPVTWAAATSSEAMIESKTELPANNARREDHKGAPKGKILIVEDNMINQTVAERMLKRLGYVYQSVGNGLEALQVISDVPFDLVLMDCQMPEMDGYAATSAIRESPKRSIPIIAMTAGATLNEKLKCAEAGMDDFISKPVRLKDLENVLNKWLHNSGYVRAAMGAHFLEFNSNSIIGIRSLDEQHFEMEELMKALHQLLISGSSDKERIIATMTKLRCKAKEHFEYEEKLFMGTAYPDAKLHVERHRAWLETFETLCGKIMRGDDVRRLELFVILNQWMTEHLYSLDQGLIDYVSEADFAKTG